MTLGVVIVGIGLLGTLYADRRESVALRWAFKPLASAGFMVIALKPLLDGGSLNALHVGLALSAVGDVALVPRSKKLFLLGLGSFALAHVAYLAHFLKAASQDPPTTTLVIGAVTVIAFMAIGHRVWTWLAPHTGSMRLPVRVYVLLVSLMAASAVTAGTLPAAAWWLAPLGGVLFYLSDLSVARDRFIAHSFANKAWGLPLYYVGQVLIAIAATR